MVRNARCAADAAGLSTAAERYRGQANAGVGAAAVAGRLTLPVPSRRLLG
jgi:hypothetical protein